MDRVRIALIVIASVVGSSALAAPAPFTKPARHAPSSVRQETEGFELAKQELTKRGIFVEEVRREGAIWIVECNDAKGNPVGRFTVRNARNRSHALCLILIDEWGTFRAYSSRG